MPAAKPNRRSRKRPADRGLPILPITVGVIALLGIVAVVASRGGDDGATTPEGTEQTRPVTVEGEPLAVFESDGADPAVGRAAPELDGARFDGRALRIGADDRPKVLVFLAHWCPHCRREVPVLASWLADHGAPEHVDLYGVATGTSPNRPNYPPSAWLQREDFSVPVLADDAEGSAGEAFGLSAFPYFVAVDAQHRVVARASGELTVDEWEGLIEQAAR
jgi:thiol-disulfide isomerase/thioredoxin